ncbi:MAG TPA: ATP-dependent RNA helicase HrpA [Rhodocyclaceae bacterium]|nr:ATP-dependent RNA helicase HrpA [Rhodocyclaceae bacterium]
MRLSVPEQLPIAEHVEEITRALRDHQVVIVCGETGSGKTTQLPKVCLDLGRGAAGLIGHTQPRRIAARATATRIAQELNSELGRIVGYKIRFTDRSSADSYIKLMTDGILLAETQGDPELRQYDTIILDEAHERSLNIDFLLGYLRQLLPRRPELKVIVTSATLDAERFARHFDDAPVIEVSGRLYPIEMRYRPVQEEADERGRDVLDAIVDAVDEAQRAGPGDVLVFLPGEREIREAAEALRKHHFGAGGVKASTEILPLFARQSAQEQQRIFQPHHGRRVVLATNVAETSLTVPGIRYVVDTGLARIKRYSHRNKVEQLQIEPVSQAAARQRAGRCGRLRDGVCIRLYAEEDLAKRPAHTDPEVLRSSLAGVILRMKSLGLGAVEEFPFLDAPQPRMIADGYQLLAELGAVDEDKELTRSGRELAKLPLDPRIGRMILAAREEGALAEVLVIAAALSVQDPRDRPAEQAGSADQAHAKWRDERSEFLAYLKLWQAFDALWQHQSQSKQREWCRANFLSYLRMREWRDIHGQLHGLCAEHGWRENQQPAGFDAIHRALLAGLLGNIGLKAEAEPHYLGARGIRFFPHPGSALAKKAGRWIVCAELVETSRLFGRCLAKIEPEWLERVGAHLVRRHVYDPHWEKNAGQVMAWERATLHGITLYARRPVAYGKIDPKLARETFIREALVHGELPDEVARRAAFFQHNRKLAREIEALEHKSRRPDVLVDEDLVHAFYDALIPPEVIDVRGFEHWRRQAEQERPRLLYLERDQLMRHEAAGITTDRFPAALDLHGQKLKLSYKHEPGEADDGVSLTVPLAMLNQIPANRCEWLVPGLLEEKVRALAKTLPQKIRHRLAPLDAFCESFADRDQERDQPLLRVLQQAVEAHVQLKLPIDAFRGENLPAHLSMNFRLVDEHGRLIAQSRNLAELRSRHARQVEERFEEAESEAAELSGLTTWSFGDLPELMEVKAGGRTTIGFPALVDCASSVSVRVFDTQEKARAAHRAGLRRLFALNLAEQLRYVEKSLPGMRDLALAFLPLGTEAELKAQIVAAALERTCMADPLPGDAAAFQRRREEARPRIALVAQELARLAGTILAEHAQLSKKLAALKAFPAPVEDVRAQLMQLLTKDFLAAVPFERLQHFPRYLKAIAMRLDKLRADPARDERSMREYQQLARPYERERTAHARSGVPDPALEQFRWLLEELRVALYAQELKTPVPVSVKRLQKIWESRAR